MLFINFKDFMELNNFEPFKNKEVTVLISENDAIPVHTLKNIKENNINIIFNDIPYYDMFSAGVFMGQLSNEDIFLTNDEKFLSYDAIVPVKKLIDYAEIPMPVKSKRGRKPKKIENQENTGTEQENNDKIETPNNISSEEIVSFETAITNNDEVIVNEPAPTIEKTRKRKARKIDLNDSKYKQDTTLKKTSSSLGIKNTKKTAYQKVEKGGEIKNKLEEINNKKEKETPRKKKKVNFDKLMEDIGILDAVDDIGVNYQEALTYISDSFVDTNDTMGLQIKLQIRFGKDNYEPIYNILAENFDLVKEALDY